MDRTKPRNQPSMFETGKLPPQATEFEQAVLGAILLESDALDNVINLLKPEYFYDPKHVGIYLSILELANKNSPIDLMTVTAQLKKNGKIDISGGAYYVTSLTNRVASSANIEYHSKIIYQKYVQREIIKICGEIGNEAYDEGVDGFELLDKAENLLFQLTSNSIDTNISGDIKEAITAHVKSFDEKDSKELSGIDTGDSKINEITGGLQNSDLILLAARPGVGKTARLLKIAKSAWVNQKKKGIIFSLEMNKSQIVMRLLSEASEFSGNNFRNKSRVNQLDIDRLNKGAALVYEYGFEVYDKSAININFIKTVAKKFKKKHGQLDYIGVDYLQLMKSSENTKGNREQEISQISGALKALAKDLNIPIIALAQLSRQLESRSDKRPLLSDLRESGSLEQDADLILFLYRASLYYDITNDPDYGKDQDSSVTTTNYTNLVEVIIAKHRNGSTGDVVKEKFIGEFFKFEEWNNFTSNYQYPTENKENLGTITLSQEAIDFQNPPF